MRRHAPFEPIDPYICLCGGVADVINCAKFRENPSKGFGAVRPRKTTFPIGIVHRPYNSVGTSVPHCDFMQRKQSLSGVFFSEVNLRHDDSLILKHFNLCFQFRDVT